MNPQQFSKQNPFFDNEAAKVLMNETLREKRIRIASLGKNDNLKAPYRELAALKIHNQGKRDITPISDKNKETAYHFMKEYEITGITPKVEKSFLNKTKLVSESITTTGANGLTATGFRSKSFRPDTPSQLLLNKASLNSSHLGRH